MWGCVPNWTMTTGGCWSCGPAFVSHTRTTTLRQDWVVSTPFMMCWPTAGKSGRFRVSRPAGQRESVFRLIIISAWKRNSLSSVRLRYQLLTNYWLSAYQKGRVWSVIASAEGFVKLVGDDSIREEQVRVTAGIQRDMGMRRRLAIEVSWQQETLFFRPGETVNEFILRVRLYR